MKRFFTLSAPTIVLCFVFLISSFVSKAQCFLWTNEGSAGFSGAGSHYSSIATDASGVPYVVYMDESVGNKATVKKMSGGVWTTVGTTGFTPSRADYTSVAVSATGVPYVVYMDHSASEKASVMRFNGTSWVNVGATGFTPGKAENTIIAIDATGTPYVAFIDWVASRRVSVMKFNGAEWQVVGSYGISVGQASYIDLALNSSGLPSVIYKDLANGGKATVQTFNGSVWGNIGTPGISAGEADYVSLTFANDTFFIAYADASIGRKLVARKYNGVSWLPAGTAGFSTGRANDIALTTDAAGVPYICYSDSATGYKMTVARYNGSTWTTTGTSAFTADSTNFNSIAISPTNKIYVAFADGNTANRVSVMSFDNGIGPISGNRLLCPGTSQTLSNFLAGGTWSSSSTSIATVSATGIVSGMAAGTAIISYTATGSCGVATATAVVTVNAYVDAISGSTSLCTGIAASFASTTTGGTWSSSNTTVGTISTSSGAFLPIATGTTIITYALAGYCSDTAFVTVTTTPSVITGALTVCSGGAATLSSAPAGGTWVSSSPSVATISSPGGVVSAVAAGTTTMTYTLVGGCNRVAVLTVNATPPAITGTTEVCVSGNTPLSNALVGGVWTSSNTAVATVVSSTGVVVGVTPGTVHITYTVAGGCNTNTVVTVQILPSTITGPSSVCVGSVASLTCTPTGGTWSSSNTAVATTSGSVVTGISAGTANITYQLASGCSRVLFFNVTAPPTSIAGTTTVCEGTSSTLSSFPPGGTWSASNSNVTVGTSTGVVTGVTVGTSTISYQLGSGCFVTTTVTINASPAIIVGASNVCVGMSATLTSTPTGTWSSSSLTTATVGSSTGVVTGIAPGTVTIFYTIPSGCYRIKVMTVNAMPTLAVVSGPTSVCVGDSVSLTASIAGGLWSISTGRAFVSAAGKMRGIASGVDTVLYSIPTVCGLIATRYPVTVNAIPSAGTLIGPTEVCSGNTISLSSTVSGGTWRSSNVVFAGISSSGTVTGYIPGAVTIFYRVFNACGADTATADITITTLPVAAATTALADSVCVGDTVRLFNATAGGSWSSIDASVGSVDASGLVTGIGFGPVTFRYIVTNDCGADTANYTIYVKRATECLTRTEEWKLSETLLYPNPCQRFVTIEVPEEGTALIIAVDGRTLASLTLKKGINGIDLSHFAGAGLYTVHIRLSSGKSTAVKLVLNP
jgi:uncharacterized protein YjdB